MKISIVVTVEAETKKEAKEKIIEMMNVATVDLVEFPEWGFHDEYKGEKVKK